MFRGSRATVSPDIRIENKRVVDPAFLSLEQPDTSIRSVVAFEREEKPLKGHLVTGTMTTDAGTATAATRQQPRKEEGIGGKETIAKVEPLSCNRGGVKIESSHSRNESVPSFCAATEGSASTTNDTDAATIGSIASTFGSSASLKRTTSQSSNTNASTVVVNRQPLQLFPEGGTFLIPQGSFLCTAPPITVYQQQNEQPSNRLDASRSAADNSGLTPTFDSNLSLRALYVQDHDLNQQNEYFEHDEQSDYDHDHLYDARAQNLSKVNDYTPPDSLDTTPTNIFSKPNDAPTVMEKSYLVLPPAAYTAAAPPAGSSHATHASFAAESAASSVSTSGGIFGHRQQQQQQPVLYSAIGSLEDPNSSSYKGWKNHCATTTKKFEFPSTQFLLAPPAQVAAKKKNALESSMQQQHQQRRGELATPDKRGSQASQRQEKPQNHLESQKRASVLKNKPLNDDDESKSGSVKSDKKVTIAAGDVKPKSRKSRKQTAAAAAGPVEMFRPCSDAYTPRMGKKEIKYKPAAMRTPVQQMASPLGTLSRPNFRDALRRVAMIIHQHIVKIERRFESKQGGQVREVDGLFSKSMRDLFSEDKYRTPRYKCTMVRVPMARSGMVCGLKQIRENYEIPSESEIYEFAHRLFKSVQLSSECSIVGLIYVERLMEASKVPLLADTWRPIFMCGLLLASKVWQDLSSWNIEFASVYPQYSLDSINRLELQFLRMVKWDLYISSSQYAKYYFALRSLVEKPDFRQRYNRMVGGVDTVQESQARKIEERSTRVREEAISQLSRSM